MKNKQFIELTALSFIISCCIGCNAGMDKREALQSSSTKGVEEVQVSGVGYSDSTVNDIVDEMMERVYPTPIDTFSALHGFELAKFKHSGIKKITLDTIAKYATVNNPVTKAQAELLGITDYFANLTYSDDFKLFLFYNKSMESHYGNSIDLIAIDNNSNNIEKLTLCQEYLSEGYEWKTECLLLNNHQFEITKTEYFNTSNLDKADDRVSVSKAIYGVDKRGQIIKIK